MKKYMNGRSRSEMTATSGRSGTPTRPSRTGHATNQLATTGQSPPEHVGQNYSEERYVRIQ